MLVIWSMLKLWMGLALYAVLGFAIYLWIVGNITVVQLVAAFVGFWVLGWIIVLVTSVVEKLLGYSHPLD